MNPFRRFFGNSFAMIAAKLVNQAAGMVLYMVMARKFSLTDFGQYALVMSVYFGFLNLAFLGFDNYLTREVARRREDVNHIFVSSVLLRSGLALLVIMLCLAFVRVMQYSPGAILGTTIISVLLISDTIAMIMDSIFLAFEKMVRISLLYVAVNFARTIVCLVLLLLGYGVLPLIVAFVLFQMAYTTVEFVLFRRMIIRPWFVFDGAFCKQMLVASLPFALIAIISTVFLRTDVILISKLIGEGGVGLYSAAYKIMQIGWIVIATLVLSLYPGMCRAYAVSLDRFRSGVEKVIEVMVILLLPILVTVSLLGRGVLSLIYSSKYEGASGVFVVLLWFLLPFAIDQVLVRVLFALGRPRLNLVGLGVGAVANIIGGLLLIPRLGLVGAGVSLLCSMALIMSMDYFFVARSIEVSMVRIGLRPVVAAALMGLMLGLLRDLPLAIAAAASLTVYSISVLFLGVFRKSDINLLRQLLEPSALRAG